MIQTLKEYKEKIDDPNIKRIKISGKENIKGITSPRKEKLDDPNIKRITSSLKYKIDDLSKH